MTKARDLANAGTALTTVSATELGYLDGVTSAVQTQLDAKQAVVSGVNDTEIGYLDGVTSAIQTQLDAKAVYPSQTGNSGKYLTTDGTNASWGTVAGGYTPTLTLLNSGGTSLSGSVTTISGISGKQWLYAYVVGASTNTASNSAIGFQLNTDTGSNYPQAGMLDVGGGVSSFGVTDTFWLIGLTGSATGAVSGYTNIWNCNSTTPKPFLASGIGSGSGYRSYMETGHYSGTSAISSISVTCSAGSFDAGTIYVYGA